jgi:hypothetical protein
MKTFSGHCSAKTHKPDSNFRFAKICKSRMMVYQEAIHQIQLRQLWFRQHQHLKWLPVASRYLGRKMGKSSCQIVTTSIDRCHWLHMYFQVKFFMTLRSIHSTITHSLKHLDMASHNLASKTTSSLRDFLVSMGIFDQPLPLAKLRNATRRLRVEVRMTGLLPAPFQTTTMTCISTCNFWIPRSL